MRLSDKSWSPYATGIIIGMLQIPAFLLIETALGTSSSYVTLAAHLASLFDGGVGNHDYLAKHMWGAKNLWQLAMVAGIVLGAFASSRLSGMPRRIMSPVWSRTVGISTFGVRAPMAFAGGFAMVFGARIADGCTTGHGISGIAQLSVGSTVAVASMFAGAIAVALLMKRV